MCAVHWVGTTVLTALLFVPLLTELGSNHNRHYYKHGAPSGAVLWGPCPIPMETTSNLIPGSSLCPTQSGLGKAPSGAPCL